MPAGVDQYEVTYADGYKENGVSTGRVRCLTNCPPVQLGLPVCSGTGRVTRDTAVGRIKLTLCGLKAYSVLYTHTYVTGTHFFVIEPFLILAPLLLCRHSEL